MLIYILLVFSITIDCFIASFIYASSKIKIPLKSALIISLIGTLSLGLSMTASSFIAQYIPADVCKLVSFFALLTIGVGSVFQTLLKKLINKYYQNSTELLVRIKSLNLILKIYADQTVADLDSSKELNTMEAVSLAVALSVDSLAIGLSSGLFTEGVHVIFIVLILSFIGHIAALLAGFFSGSKFSEKLKIDLSPVSGILLILFAVLRIL